MGSVSITVELDLYVKQSQPTISFNSDHRLIVGAYDSSSEGESGGITGICRTWLKFDLSTLISAMSGSDIVTSAMLYVKNYHPHNVEYSSRSVEVARCTDVSWTSSMTWNSAPNGSVQSAAAALDFEEYFNGIGTISEINITSAVTSALNDSATQLALRLKLDIESVAYTLLHDSDYSGAYAPFIDITYGASEYLNLPCQDNAETFNVTDTSPYAIGAYLAEGVTATYSTVGPGGILTKSFNATLMGIDNAIIYCNSLITIVAGAGGCIEFYAKLDSPTGQSGVMGAPGLASNVTFYDTTICVSGNDEIGDYIVSGSTGVTVTNWHHYALNINQDQSVRLYIDAVDKGLLTGGPNDTIGGYDITIEGFGTDFWNYFPMNGKLCAIRIYGAVRTQSQINADYLEGVTSSAPFARPATANRNRTYLRM